MRPLLHFTPERGWMNDPNGLIERAGVHHLFFQHNPGDVTFGRMCWGHATSTDLITWVEDASALVPGGPGADGLPVTYDRDGVWSGCAVAADAGGENTAAFAEPAVLFLYTGRDGDVTLPCLARCDDPDLRVLRRDPANPVITAPPTQRTVTEFRDHVVWRDGGLWRQGIGAGSVEGRGGVFTYASADLVQWTYEGIMLEAAAWDLPGEVWECPDLLLPPLVDAGRAVLVVSLIGAPMGDCLQPVVWISGALQGSRLVPDAWGRLDLGPRFYAPQSYRTGDGRRLMFGWLREQLEPVRGEGAAGGAPVRERVGIMSLPRELTVVDGRPRQVPSAEVDAARAERPAIRQQVRDREVLELGGVLGRCFELEIAVDGDLGGSDVVVTLTGAGPSSEGVSFVVDLGALVREPSWWSREVQGWAARYEPARRARILFDCGVVEAFLDSGAAAAWTPVHLPEVASVTLGFSSATGTAGLTVWAFARP